jgi:hypothetical protein
MQCAYIKQDGSQCWANAISGSEYCWFHAPEVNYDRRSASQRGGKATRTGIYTDLPPIPLKNLDDVPELLMDTIRQVRGGFIGGRIAVTIGYLTGKLMRSFEMKEIDHRIRKLESEVKDLKSKKMKKNGKRKEPVQSVSSP